MSPRPWIERVVQRIAPTADWDNLTLPEESRDGIRRMVEAVKVSNRPGSPGSNSTARPRAGITALFTGPASSQKVLAAQLIARETGSELYRVDLSMVAGESAQDTERSMRRILDAAEQAGGVLFFDEADGLFPAGSGDDPHPDLGGRYLLKRMGRYRDPSILAVTSRQNLDPALLRKLRFIVEVQAQA